MTTITKVFKWSLLGLAILYAGIVAFSIYAGISWMASDQPKDPDTPLGLLVNLTWIGILGLTAFATYRSLGIGAVGPIGRLTLIAGNIFAALSIGYLAYTDLGALILYLIAALHLSAAGLLLITSKK